MIKENSIEEPKIKEGKVYSITELDLLAKDLEKYDLFIACAFNTTNTEIILNKTFIGCTFRLFTSHPSTIFDNPKIINSELSSTTLKKTQIQGNFINCDFENSRFQECHIANAKFTYEEQPSFISMKEDERFIVYDVTPKKVIYCDGFETAMKNDKEKIGHQLLTIASNGLEYPFILRSYCDFMDGANMESEIDCSLERKYGLIPLFINDQFKPYFIYTPSGSNWEIPFRQIDNNYSNRFQEKDSFCLDTPIHLDLDKDFKRQPIGFRPARPFFVPNRLMHQQIKNMIDPYLI